MKKSDKVVSAPNLPAPVRNTLPANYNEAFQLQMNSENLIKEFFEQVNICDTDKISDFLNALERKERGSKSAKFSEENLQKLLSRINALLADREIKLSAKDIGILLNSLAGLGYKKEDLQTLNINKLVEVTNKQIDIFGAYDVSYICNGFARLAFDKDEISLDVNNLSRVINRKINNFRNLEPAIALHAFAQMGFVAENIEEETRESLKKLIKQAKKETSFSDVRAISGLVHSLAKMEMFDELFEIKNQVTAAFGLERIESLSSESASSLLQAQMICDLIYGEKFFDEEKINHISKKYEPRKDEISDLQNLIAKSFPQENISQEEAAYEVGSTQIRNIDISYKIGNKVFFIEVDGPSHFSRAKDGSLQVNNATKQRDALNEAAISEMATSQPSEEFHYLKLSFEEIEKIVGRKNKLSRSEQANLNQFLIEKLEVAKKIEPKIFEEQTHLEVPDEILEEQLEELKMAEIFISLPEEKPNRKIADIFADLEKSRSVKHIKKLMHEARSKSDITDGKSLLHLAVEDNNLKLVSKLISLGHQLDATDAQGNSVLHIAAQNNFSAIAKKLVEEKANSNLANQDGKTALEIAVEAGDENLNIVEILAKAKIEPQIVEAANAGIDKEKNPKIAKVLSDLVESYDINFKYKERLISGALPLKMVNFLGEKLAQTRYSEEILSFAKEQNRSDITAAMLKSGAAFPAAKEQMMLDAILHNNLDIAEALVGRGLDLNQPLNEDGLIALNFVLNVEPVNIEMVNMLISGGAQIPQEMPHKLSTQKAQDLLRESLSKNQIEAATALLKLDSTQVEAGMLTEAIKKNFLPIVSAITQKEGFDVNSPESKSALLQSSKPNINIGIFNEMVKAGGTVEGLPLTDLAWQDLLVTLSHSEYEESFNLLVRKNIEKLKNMPFTKYNQGKLNCLFLAIINNHHEVAIDLIRAGANANVSTIEGFSPLILAIDKGQTDVAYTLIREGKADINKVALNGVTPFLRACQLGNEEIVDILLKNKKLKIDHKFSEGFNALHLASDSGNKAVVDKLIATGKFDISAVNDRGLSALHIAAQLGSLGVVQSLVGAGAKLNNLTEKGATSLYMAVDRGHTDVADFLLTFKGVGVNQGINDNKYTPLHRAIDTKNYPLMRSLIKHKANVDLTTSDETSPIYRATQSNDIEAVEILINGGANLNFATKKSISALSLAVRKGYADIVESMISSGRLDVNLPNPNDDTTAIFSAANNGHLEITRMLLAAGADPSIVARKVNTPPIHLSASKGYAEITEELLAGGKANVDAADIQGTTALHLAVCEKHGAVVKILLENKANVNAANIDKQTALHMAAIIGDAEIMRDLVAVDGVRFEEDKDGETPLDVARKNGNSEIVTILEEAQKRVNEVKKMAESDPKNTTTTLQQSKELDLADSKISTPPPESPPKAIGKTEAKPLRDNLSKIILPT